MKNIKRVNFLEILKMFLDVRSKTIGKGFAGVMKR